MNKATLLSMALAVLVLGGVIPSILCQKILVTGGAGFIGSHVTQCLLERGDTVIVIDDLNDYYDPRIKQANLDRLKLFAQPEQLVFYHLDICNNKRLSSVIASEQPDSICHLAARAGVRASVQEPELYLKTNWLGTLYILEAAVKNKIPHLVIASSSSVYGNCVDAPFNEEYRADRPCSPYAATKRGCELLAYTYHYLYGISATCLRFFTVYGPSGRPDMAPFKFMDAIYHDRPIQQYGDGSSRRDFTYVDDIVDGIIRSLDTPLGFETFNLGRGEPIYLKDFITTIEEVVGKKAIINVVPQPKGDVQLTHADVSKAIRLIGYQPTVSLREGIEKMYDWYLSDYLALKRRLKLP